MSEGGSDRVSEISEYTIERESLASIIFGELALSRY